MDNISSINAQLLAELDTTTADQLQQIAAEQDSTNSNNSNVQSASNDSVQAAQLAFAMSTIEPNNS